MAEIIDLTKYIKKREERELDELSARLANLISDLGLEEQYEMYMANTEDYVYGTPYIFTMMPPPSSDTQKVETLSDVTDVLTTLVLQLDGMGYSKWANQISDVVGEMFVSGTFK